MSEEPKRIGLDEALELISDIARNGEGADRFRALKVVMAQESSSSQLPPPLGDVEIIERLSRLIRAAGPMASQLAYRKAFPASKRPINFAAPKLLTSDVPGIDPLKLPKTLRALYRMFPEIKRPGVPKGFPVSAGMAVKAEWCAKEARKMIMDREQQKLDIIATEAALPGADNG